MSDTVEKFEKARLTDGYGEYHLDTGYVLVTDWEGDNSFNPYVVPEKGTDLNEDNMDKVREEINETFSFTVRHIEDAGNGSWNVVLENRYPGE